jgi:hypothetical protein
MWISKTYFGKFISTFWKEVLYTDFSKIINQKKDKMYIS